MNLWNFANSVFIIVWMVLICVHQHLVDSSWSGIIWFVIFVVFYFPFSMQKEYFIDSSPSSKIQTGFMIAEGEFLLGPGTLCWTAQVTHLSLIENLVHCAFVYYSPNRWTLVFSGLFVSLATCSLPAKEGKLLGSEHVLGLTLSELIPWIFIDFDYVIQCKWLWRLDTRNLVLFRFSLLVYG